MRALLKKYKEQKNAQVNPAYYQSACMADFCKLNGKSAADEDAVVCHYLSAFALASAASGVRLSDWRKDIPECRAFIYTHAHF